MKRKSIRTSGAASRNLYGQLGYDSCRPEPCKVNGFAQHCGSTGVQSNRSQWLPGVLGLGSISLVAVLASVYLREDLVAFSILAILGLGLIYFYTVRPYAMVSGKVEPVRNVRLDGGDGRPHWVGLKQIVSRNCRSGQLSDYALAIGEALLLSTEKLSELQDAALGLVTADVRAPSCMPLISNRPKNWPTNECTSRVVAPVPHDSYMEGPLHGDASAWSRDLAGHLGVQRLQPSNVIHQILTVARALDVLTSPGTDGYGLSLNQAIVVIRYHSGSVFDCEVVNALDRAVQARRLLASTHDATSLPMKWEPSSM